MKTLRLIITWVLLSVSMAVQAQDKQTTDSLRQAMNNATTDTSRAGTRIRIAYYYLDKSNADGRLDTAERYLKQAGKLMKKLDVAPLQNLMNVSCALLYSFRNPDQDAKKSFLPVIAGCSKTGDKETEALAWEYLAYFVKESPATNPFRITCYEKAMVLTRQLGFIDEQMYDLVETADIHSAQKQYTVAESELFQVIKEGKKAGPANLMVAYDLLAAIYIKKALYNKALYYELKYQKNIELAGDTAVIANSDAQLGSIYSYLGNYSSAVDWYKKSLNHLIAVHELANLFSTISSIVAEYVYGGRADEALKFLSTITTKYKPVKLQDRQYVQFSFGAIYNALKNYDMAEKSYLEMIKFGDEDGINRYDPDKAKRYQAIGNFYFYRKKYNKAQQYLETALKVMRKGGNVEILRNVHLALFEVDSALGNYKAAIRHLQQNNRLKDSIFNIARYNQVEELNIQYQTDEKEKDVKLARDKAKLEQVQLERTQNGRNWIIAGSGLLLIIVALLYRQSRLRKKNNKIITRQNELITQKNELLQSLVSEKEWLLKEVHHRVKNNLHTVICLLESQARHLESDALKAIENSKHRIYAMSLIHQKLYQSDDIKTIDMAAYIAELAQSLQDGFGTSNQIQFELNITPVNLDISHAIPLGLIINEAVTNSIKYAFPNNRKGEISILMINDGNRIKLELADNGIGMPEIDHEVEPESLGLRLMKGLSEDIDADISFKVINGTRISIIFKPDALNEPYNILKLSETGEALT